MKREEDFNTDVLTEFIEDEDVASMVKEAQNAPLSVRSLIDAGARFGHRKIHKSMEPFVYNKSSTGCSINMDMSYTMIRYICDFLYDKVSNGYKVVILGDRSSAEFSSVLNNYSKTHLVSYITKYRGGILTNFETLHKSITKYKELVAKKVDLESRIANAESRSIVGAVGPLKKMLLEVTKTINNDYRDYEGLRYLGFVERCIFITPSIKRSEKFIAELNLFNTRKTPDKCSYIIGLADSDADVSTAVNIISYSKDDARNYNKYVLPVFANDDKLNVLIMILDTFFVSINAGREAYDAVNKKKAAEVKKTAGPSPRPSAEA